MGLFLSILTLYAPPTKAILDLLAPVKWLVTGHYIDVFSHTVNEDVWVPAWRQSYLDRWQHMERKQTNKRIRHR